MGFRPSQKKMRSLIGLFLCLFNLLIVAGFYHDLLGLNRRYRSEFGADRRKVSETDIQHQSPHASSTTTFEEPSNDIEAIQTRRRNTLREGCKSYGLNMTFDLSRELGATQLRGLDHVFVIPQVKVLYCAVPKVACTSWKKLIFNITGIVDILKKRVIGNVWKKTSVHDITPQYFRTLSSYPPQEAREIVRTYTSFTFARNPYTRILSAYKDKFTLDAKTKWVDEMLQWVIRESPKRASDVFTSRRKFSFTEFLEYYLSPINKNPHWREYYRLCRPCHIDYDFIGNYETLAEDSAYVVRNLFNASASFALIASGRKTGSSSDDALRNSYAEVPRALLHHLSMHDGITIDSKLFGYGVPDVIQDMLT